MKHLLGMQYYFFFFLVQFNGLSKLERAALTLRTLLGISALAGRAWAFSECRAVQTRCQFLIFLIQMFFNILQTKLLVFQVFGVEAQLFGNILANLSNVSLLVEQDLKHVLGHGLVDVLELVQLLLRKDTGS